MESRTNLSIYDVAGREVAVLVDENQPAGYHQILWDGKDSQGSPVGNGVYFYRLNARNGKDSEFTATKKMVILR
jgi:flagellar hook assembly protein FlgD